MSEARPQALFGTDGVRGVAGEQLTGELARALGRAATEGVEARRPQVVIVRDTRESSPELAAELAAGVADAGGDSFDAGVLPTPAASILVRRLGLDLAAVVSASHNPWRDNGIKFFAANGGKLDPEAERAIERRVAAGPEGDRSSGVVRTLEASLDDYLRELGTAFRLDLGGRRIALDCANGATYEAAPAIFRRLGAEVELIAAAPDGRNINAGCGSTDPAALAELVGGGAAEIGFAFDGDGDRVLAVDGRGRIRDGDELIALAALHLKRRDELHGGGVAVTVMTNYGFHQAMTAAGIEVATTDVGDRHVAAELVRREWALGGEQSGHIIWADYAPTGDGVAAALLVLAALGDAPLAEVEPFARLPQVLVNVEVADRDALAEAEAVWAAADAEAAALEDRGRVLVRPSGTEPLVRVMVEAPTADEAEAICRRLVDVVRSELGPRQ